MQYMDAWLLAEMVRGSTKGGGKQSLPGGGHVASFHFLSTYHSTLIFLSQKAADLVDSCPSCLLSRPPFLSFLLSR